MSDLALQLGLEIFNGGQAALKLFWQGFSELVLGYAHRLVKIAQRVFGDGLVF